MPIMKTYRDVLAGAFGRIDERNVKTLKSLVLAGISSLLFCSGGGEV